MIVMSFAGTAINFKNHKVMRESLLLFFEANSHVPIIRLGRKTLDSDQLKLQLLPEFVCKWLNGLGSGYLQLKFLSIRLYDE